MVKGLGCALREPKNSRPLFSPQNVIAEHEIRNISCAAQDPEDLCTFAYITKDLQTSHHYCHVFSTVDVVGGVRSWARWGVLRCDSPSAVGPGTRLALSKGLFKNEHHSSPLYLALRLKHTGRQWLVQGSS